MGMTPEQEERLPLAQQRRGYSRLCFVPELEEGFVSHRVQRIRRRMLLIVSTALIFQLVYCVLDLLFLPLAVGLISVPVRLLAMLSVVFSFFYCRRTQSDPHLSLLAYAAAYGLNGASVVVVIYVCWGMGVAIPYDGLFLVLTEAGSELAYQGLFLICANLIGSIGAYLQEHGQRGAWLNLRLLDLARQRAEADDARKLRLLAAASHDRRQPLNAMGLYAQHLMEQSQEAGTQRISSRLATSVEQLSRLLQSLFDYSRMTLPGGVQVKLEVVALAPLLARLSEESRAEAEAQGVALQLQCEALWVRSDPLLLERVLRNLLANALRHAQAGQVWLRARAERDVVLLEVGDDGRGLSAEQQDRVFEEFQQLDNPGRNAERGLGLGLAIVKQLAELLEHPLRLHSSPGQGARFVLQLKF